VGKITPERGFSTFKFLPGTRDNVILALKSVEEGATGKQVREGGREGGRVVTLKFLPGTRENVILALKSVEEAATKQIRREGGREGGEKMSHMPHSTIDSRTHALLPSLPPFLPPRARTSPYST